VHFKQLSAIAAIDAIMQNMILLAQSDQFIEQLAIPACADISDCAIVEMIGRDRSGFPQIGWELDSEFGV
jgi:hypothetical protein